VSQPDDNRSRDVLVVGAEALVAPDLATALRARGLGIAGPFSSCREVIAVLAGSRPVAAVIDAGLEDGAGLSIARELRRRDLPIVFLSRAESFRPEALDEWGDALWIAKPVASAHLGHILDGLARRRAPRSICRAA
jgi:DNA-binding response OmpR family regulator